MSVVALVMSTLIYLAFDRLGRRLRGAPIDTPANPLVRHSRDPGTDPTAGERPLT